MRIPRPSRRTRPAAAAVVQPLEGRRLMSLGATLAVAPAGATAARVAESPTGQFAVVWEDTAGADGSGHGIMARLYNADDTPATPAFVVDTTTTGNQVSPDVAFSRTGDRFVVGWTDMTDNMVRGRAYDSTGAAVTGEFAVDGTNVNYTPTPNTPSSIDGSVVVGCRDDGGFAFDYFQVVSGGGNVLNEGYYVRLTTAAGVPVAPGVQPAYYVDQLLPAGGNGILAAYGGHQQAVSAAGVLGPASVLNVAGKVDASGVIHAVATSGPTIRATSLSPANVALGSSVQTAANNPTSSQVAASLGGTYAAFAYTEGTRLDCQLFNGTSQPVTLSAVLAGSPTAGSQQVAVDDAGRAVLVWTDAATGGLMARTTAVGPATVTAVAPATDRYENAPQVSWTVTFSEPTGGLSAANLRLVTTGLGGSPAIASVTPVGDPYVSATWTVTAGTGTGSGTIGLNFVDPTGLGEPVTNTMVGGVYAMQVPTTSATAFAAAAVPAVAFGAAADTVTGRLSGTTAVPTGSVSVSVGGRLTSAAVAADGTFAVAVPTAGLAPGTHTAVLSYAGDGTSAAVTTAVDLTVAAAPATVTATPPAVVLHAATATLTGRVDSPAGTSPVGGTVAVTVGRRTALAVVAADGSFAATVDTAGLAVGAYPVAYTFTGTAAVAAGTAQGTLSVGYAVTQQASAARPHRRAAAVRVGVAVADANRRPQASPVTVVSVTDAAGDRVAVPGRAAFRRVGRRYVWSARVPAAWPRGTYDVRYAVAGEATARTATVTV